MKTYYAIWVEWTHSKPGWRLRRGVPLMGTNKREAESEARYLRIFDNIASATVKRVRLQEVEG